MLFIASLRRLVVTPLSELRRASREIGLGDLSPSLLVHSNDELGERKRRYMNVAEKVKAAVERGELSAEEAERKLVEVRRELFNEDK